MPNVVRLSRLAQRQLAKLPPHIVGNLHAWVRVVESFGLNEARKIPGYHDEPLKGMRAGQRSIRLNRAYRAIYSLSAEGAVELVVVEEVSKHGY